MHTWTGFQTLHSPTTSTKCSLLLSELLHYYLVTQFYNVILHFYAVPPLSIITFYYLSKEIPLVQYENNIKKTQVTIMSMLERWLSDWSSPKITAGLKTVRGSEHHMDLIYQIFQFFFSDLFEREYILIYYTDSVVTFEDQEIKRRLYCQWVLMLRVFQNTLFVLTLKKETWK